MVRKGRFQRSTKKGNKMRLFLALCLLYSSTTLLAEYENLNQFNKANDAGQGLEKSESIRGQLEADESQQRADFQKNIMEKNHSKKKPAKAKKQK